MDSTVCPESVQDLQMKDHNNFRTLPLTKLSEWKTTICCTSKQKRLLAINLQDSNVGMVEIDIISGYFSSVK